MTRLPPAARVLWPAARNAHRLAARTGRHVGRLTPADERATPRTASATSAATAAAEPHVVRRVSLADSPTPVRPTPVGAPAPLRFWGEVNQAPNAERFVLDVAGGRLVGEYAALVTPGGVLDHETSPYWGRAWREHPIFIRPRLAPPTQVDGTVVALASPGSQANYYHSLMDTLPRWGLLREAFPDLVPDAVVVGHSSRWDQQLLAMLGLDQHRLMAPGPHLRADRLLVPSLANSSTLAPRWITEWLQANLPAGSAAGRPRRIYVTRGSTPNTRRFVREPELLALLERLGFVAFDPGAHSVQEQIDTFAAAEVIVAPHGAGLANLNFARPGVRLLELFAPRYLNPGFWAITSNIADSRYRYLVADPVRPERPARKMLGVQNDIDLAPTAVMDALEELLAT